MPLSIRLSLGPPHLLLSASESDTELTLDGVRQTDERRDESQMWWKLIAPTAKLIYPPVPGPLRRPPLINISRSVTRYKNAQLEMFWFGYWKFHKNHHSRPVFCLIRLHCAKMFSWRSLWKTIWIPFRWGSAVSFLGAYVWIKNVPVNYFVLLNARRLLSEEYREDILVRCPSSACCLGGNMRLSAEIGLRHFSGFLIWQCDNCVMSMDS